MQVSENGLLDYFIPYLWDGLCRLGYRLGSLSGSLCVYVGISAWEGQGSN